MPFKFIPVLSLIGLLFLTSGISYAQVEELPEDKPGGYKFDPCQAREAAINATEPKSSRETFTRAELESTLKENEIWAGITEYDEAKYKALLDEARKRKIDEQK